MKNLNVVIVHGAYGDPDENWFGWLKNELTKINISCHIPQLPTPENQNLAHWLNIFTASSNNRINSNTVLIGHSLGAAFVLHWLAQQDKKILGTVLAGAFIGKVGIEKFDSINTTFFEKPFDWSLIKRNSEQFICYHGDNDPYVSSENFHFIANNLSAKKIVISKGGHLNAASGYTRFPHLLMELKQWAEITHD